MSNPCEEFFNVIRQMETQESTFQSGASLLFTNWTLNHVQQLIKTYTIASINRETLSFYLLSISKSWFNSSC